MTTGTPHRPHRHTARELIDLVADPGSFTAWDGDVVSDDPLGFTDTTPYRERLAEAEERTGHNESVVTGTARIDGIQFGLIVGEFSFMAGTMGLAAAERIVRAFERSASLRIPVLGMPASGGTRMQEGAIGFVQMATVSAAVGRFRKTGLTYIAYLRDPTTGGVLGSWGSLAHVTFAQPGALIGLTGPRVLEQLSGEPFPEGIQVAEHLRDHGVIDDVVAPEDLRARVLRVLAATQSPATGWDSGAGPLSLPDAAAIDGWTAVERARRTDRPGIRELLDVCAREVTPIRGDGAGTDDRGCVAMLARVTGIGVVLLGHDRRPGERGAALTAAGYRKAKRAMDLAEELGLPLVTIIDTQGARNAPADEEQGIAGAIARCLATMTGLTVPTMSLLFGEGSGGGAVAFLPADRVVAAEHAWLAPIAPEGASSILHRTTAHAADLARSQAISSTELRNFGVVDVVIPDRPSADDEGERFGQRIAATAARELRLLLDQPPGVRLRARERRYRALGRLSGSGT